MARRRLGLLGPVIFGIGVIAAIGLLWFSMRSRPTPGAVIDTFVIDGGEKLVVRAEDGGERSFIELHDGDKLRWQAMVPTYAGRAGVPGVAWGEIAVSVRVVRDGRAELFALSRRDASKLGGLRLAKDHGKIKRDATGPVTLTDHMRSYEIIAGEDWNQLAAVDLKIGKVLWTVELGATPVTTGGVDGGALWIEQAGKRRWFRVFDGKEDRTIERIGLPPTDGVPPLPPETTPDTSPSSSAKQL